MPDGLIALIILMLIGFCWSTALQARECANRAASDACKRFGLQRLDESCVMRRLQLKRQAGGVTLEQIFSFEFSRSGAERRSGYIGVVNRRAVWAGIENDSGTDIIDLSA